MRLPRTFIRVFWGGLLLTTILLKPIYAQIPAHSQPTIASPKHSRTHNIEQTQITNVEYAKVDNISLKLDIYLPNSVPHPLPTVVWVHGGAWRSGDKASARLAADLLVPHGYAVVGINYRLSQQAIFPAQIHDVKAAIRWIRAHAANYNLDPDHIGAWGASAGGHLVALLGTSGNVSTHTVGHITLDIEGSVGDYPSYSSQVQAVVDWFGPTDFLRMDDALGSNNHNRPHSPESRLIGGPIQANPELSTLANPITYVSVEDPPFLIMHGTQDQTVPINQSELLYESLQATLTPQGTEVTFEAVPGAGHGRRTLSRENLLNQVVTFFDQHLIINPRCQLTDWLCKGGHGVASSINASLDFIKRNSSN